MNPSASVKQGQPAPPEPFPPCVELDKRNADERAGFVKKMSNRQRSKKGLNQAEQRDLGKARRGGMTYSSARSTVPGSSGTFTQSSSGLANAHITSGGEGGTGAQKVGMNKRDRASRNRRLDAKKKKAGILCNGDHVHPGGGKGAHAECKIFNDMSNKVGATMRGGRVLLNIDWRFNKGGGGVGRSGMPCSDCYAMLCKAARDCDIEIMICDHQQRPTPLSKENCDDEDGYSDLCTRVDNSPLPGRR